MLMCRAWHCHATTWLPKCCTALSRASHTQHVPIHSLAIGVMRVTRSGRHLLSSNGTSAGTHGIAAATAGKLEAAAAHTGRALSGTMHCETTDEVGAAILAAAAGGDQASGLATQPNTRTRKAAKRHQNRKRASSSINKEDCHQAQRQVLLSRRKCSTASDMSSPAAAAADRHIDTAPAAATAPAPYRGHRRAKSDVLRQGPSADQQTLNTNNCSVPATAATGASGSVRTAEAVAGGSRGAASNAAAAAAGTSTPVLLDLGELVPGEVLKRPSATVRTPYVADVRLSCGTQVLAHTPALDCAGLMLPGSKVHMTANAPKSDGQKAGKTSHAVQLVEDVREDGSTTAVGAHPYLAEQLAEAAAALHLLPLPAELQGYTNVLKQQTVGTGRFDFVLCYEDGSRLLLEVKNAVCADYPAGHVPAKRSKVCLYTSDAEQYTRTALFPVGKANKASGVVSDRAIKHLHELTQLQQAGQDEQGRPVRCAVMFVVNRSDCSAFRTCHEADMMFARMLRRAQRAGVLVLAHDVQWAGGRALWGKPLPVVCHEAVAAADIDEQQLQGVLQFNATNPRTHWKQKKSN